MAKKIGYVGLSILAFVAAFAILNIIQIVAIMPASIKVSFEVTAQGIRDMDTIQQMTMEAITPYLPMAVFLSHAGLIICFGLWYYFGCGRPSLKKVNKKDVFAPKHIVGVLLVAIALGYFMNFLVEILYPYIPNSIVEEFEKAMEQAQFGKSPLSTFAAVFLAPFSEELIFRGVSFYYAMKAFKEMKNRTVAFWIANAIQALLFGILHMNVLQATYAFILGLILGYIAYRFKSIIPCILTHMIYNGLPSYTLEPIQNALPEGNTVKIIITAVSAVIVVVGMVMIKSKKSEILKEA